MSLCHSLKITFLGIFVLVDSEAVRNNAVHRSPLCLQSLTDTELPTQGSLAIGVQEKGECYPCFCTVGEACTQTPASE